MALLGSNAYKQLSIAELAGKGYAAELVPLGNQATSQAHHRQQYC
jgi:hypothetical protein